MLLVIETITWKPHIETAIEIALRHRDAGGEVRYLNVRQGLPACEDRSALHALVDLPNIRIDRGRKLLEHEGIAFARPSYSPEQRKTARQKAKALMAGCRSVEELKVLAHEDYFDLGWAVLSSVVSVTRDATVSPATHRKQLTGYCESAILVYEKSRELIEHYRPAEVLLFNGRFATTRAVMRAAQSTGTAWKIHERGGDKDRFWMTDCLPHDLDQVQAKIVATWRPEHEPAGHNFFHSRRNRIERDWHSYTLQQVYGSLPAPMSCASEWVTFFTSSEDEMVAIGECFAGNLFPDQMAAVSALAQAVARIDGLRLCVRVHPHVAKKGEAEQKKWAELDLPGVLLIGPTDATDTYALIDRSRVACSYGSTVGVEATYWGRPSLLFSRSYYDLLDVCEVARSEDHIEAFLREPRARSRECTLPYGAFWDQLGEPYRYYQADGLHRGSICGVYLDDTATMRASRWLTRSAARLSSSRH